MGEKWWMIPDTAVDAIKEHLEGTAEKFDCQKMAKGGGGCIASACDRSAECPHNAFYQLVSNLNSTDEVPDDFKTDEEG